MTWKLDEFKMGAILISNLVLVVSVSLELDMGLVTIQMPCQTTYSPSLGKI